MTRGLTDKQERILRFIVDYVNDTGYPPSIREIGNTFSISSLRGVTVHLDALERKGFIKRASTSRSITVLGQTGATAPQRRSGTVPLVGTIAAGVPITAAQNIEGHVPVSPDMIRSAQGAFALRVRGESMIDAHIVDGDLVIVKPQADADNGDLVAVRLDDEATVKRLSKTAAGVRLMPANPLFDPIAVEVENSEVIGKVIGLIRGYGTSPVV